MFHEHIHVPRLWFQSSECSPLHYSPVQDRTVQEGVHLVYYTYFRSQMDGFVSQHGWTIDNPCMHARIRARNQNNKHTWMHTYRY